MDELGSKSTTKKRMTCILGKIEQRVNGSRSKINRKAINLIKV